MDGVITVGCLLIHGVVSLVYLVYLLLITYSEMQSVEIDTSDDDAQCCAAETLLAYKQRVALARREQVAMGVWYDTAFQWRRHS